MKRILFLLVPVMLLVACNNDNEIEDPELEATRASYTITQSPEGSVKVDQLYDFKVSPSYGGIFTWSVEPYGFLSQVIIPEDYDPWTGDNSHKIGYRFGRTGTCKITVKMGSTIVATKTINVLPDTDYKLTQSPAGAVEIDRYYEFTMSPRTGYYTWSVEPYNFLSQIVVPENYDPVTGDYSYKIGYRFGRIGTCTLTVKDGNTVVATKTITVNPTMTQSPAGAVRVNRSYYYTVSPDLAGYTWSVEPFNAISEIIIHADYNPGTGENSNVMGFVFGRTGTCKITASRGLFSTSMTVNVLP